jgi:hypothetical protein
LKRIIFSEEAKADIRAIPQHIAMNILTAIHRLAEHGSARRYVRAERHVGTDANPTERLKCLPRAMEINPQSHPFSPSPKGTFSTGFTSTLSRRSCKALPT